MDDSSETVDIWRVNDGYHSFSHCIYATRRPDLHPKARSHTQAMCLRHWKSRRPYIHAHTPLHAPLHGPIAYCQACAQQPPLRRRCRKSACHSRQQRCGRARMCGCGSRWRAASPTRHEATNAATDQYQRHRARDTNPTPSSHPMTIPIPESTLKMRIGRAVAVVAAPSEI